MQNKLTLLVLLSVFFTLPLKADTKRYLCTTQHVSHTSVFEGVRSHYPEEFGATIFELTISKQELSFSAGSYFSDKPKVVHSYNESKRAMMVKASDERTLIYFSNIGIAQLHVARMNEIGVLSFAAKCEKF